QLEVTRELSAVAAGWPEQLSCIHETHMREPKLPLLRLSNSASRSSVGPSVPGHVAPPQHQHLVLRDTEMWHLRRIDAQQMPAQHTADAAMGDDDRIGL